MGQIGVAGWIALLFGAFLGGSAAIELGKYVAFRRRADRASATVVGLRKSTSSGGGPRPKTMYHPIVEFSTHEGRLVRSSTKAGTSPPVAREGDEVTVLFDPHAPDEIEIAGKGWIRPALLTFATVLGTFFVVVFFIGLVR